MALQSQFNLTAANAILKEIYDGQSVPNEVYKKNPFFAMVRKHEVVGGKSYPLPLQIGVTQTSATFSSAQTYQGAPIVQNFQLTQAKIYSLGTIQNDTLMSTNTDKKAFIDGVKIVVDSAMRAATNMIASNLFQNGLGSLGQISTITSAGVITLTNPQDIVFFELGQTLTASATDGGALVGSGSIGFVIAVDRNNGQLTVSATYGGTTGALPSSWAATYYIGNIGSMAAGGAAKNLTGLSGWLVSNPSATSFFGVDRSQDETRLAGVYYDGSSQSIEEALIDASSLVAREGGQPDVCFMSFASYSALLKQLGSKIQYVDIKTPYEGISFQALRIQCNGFAMDVIADRSCTAQTAYMLQLDTWALYSNGPAPQVLLYPDNNQMLRVYNDDAAELRVGAYLQLGCNAPGWNARVALSV